MSPGTQKKTLENRKGKSLVYLDWFEEERIVVHPGPKWAWIWADPEESLGILESSATFSSIRTLTSPTQNPNLDLRSSELLHGFSKFPAPYWKILMLCAFCVHVVYRLKREFEIKLNLIKYFVNLFLFKILQIFYIIQTIEFIFKKLNYSLEFISSNYSKIIFLI